MGLNTQLHWPSMHFAKEIYPRYFTHPGASSSSAGAPIAPRDDPFSGYSNETIDTGNDHIAMATVSLNIFRVCIHIHVSF